MAANINFEFNLDSDDIGRCAVLLAMTSSLEQEQGLKRSLELAGCKVCITELGGETLEFSKKLSKAVIGACLNNEVVKKAPNEIHAVLHAADEARSAFLFNNILSLNLAAKIGIVRKNNWIAISMFGYSAMSNLTNHERVGLGIMHI